MIEHKGELLTDNVSLEGSRGKRQHIFLSLCHWQPLLKAPKIVSKQPTRVADRSPIMKWLAAFSCYAADAILVKPDSRLDTKLEDKSASGV
jgi:hypothetical protein